MHDLKQDTAFCFQSEQTHEMKNIIKLWNAIPILQSPYKKLLKTSVSEQVNVGNSQILDMLEHIHSTIQSSVLKYKAAENIRQIIKYCNMEKETQKIDFKEPR